MKQNLLNRIVAGKKLFAPGAQKPVYLLNFVTNSCNAACDHCFYWQELNTNKKLELSPDEHARVAQSLGPMLQVTFTGGSPELRNDLPEIVQHYYKYCTPANMTFCMLGYSTSRIVEHVEKIMTTCKDQQVTIGISLDGLGEEHDEYRKLKGLFNRVIETVTELNKLQKSFPTLRTGIGMVVHGLNYDRVENSAKWVRENLPVDVLKPILVRGNPYNPEARAQECIGIYDRIVDRDRQWLLSANGKQIGFKDKVIRAKENVQRDIIRKISSTNQTEITCSGGRETAVMYPSGDIAGCEMRSDVLGNIRKYNYDFTKVWFSEEAHQFRKTSGKAEECEGCYHHCFLSPAIFRTPTLWPKIASSIMKLND